MLKTKRPRCDHRISYHAVSNVAQKSNMRPMPCNTSKEIRFLTIIRPPPRTVEPNARPTLITLKEQQNSVPQRIKQTVCEFPHLGESIYIIRSVCSGESGLVNGHQNQAGRRMRSRLTPIHTHTHTHTSLAASCKPPAANTSCAYRPDDRAGLDVSSPI